MQVYLEERDYKRLKKLAIDSDVTVSTLIRAVVKTYLDKKNR